MFTDTMIRRHVFCLYIPSLRFALSAGIMVCAILIARGAVGASDLSQTNSSDFMLGPLGLNTVPNARMDQAGTIKAGLSAADPYLHGYVGVQIAPPLYIQLRQSAETSNLLRDPDGFYPGLDIKLRLLRESAYAPEIAIGLHSALGERRMGGEYLAFSKRVRDFDLTAGLGWGRFGSAGHFSNPFGFLGGDYSRKRSLDGADSHEPADWFTGDEIGVFAGLEYETPLKGLSLKFDFGADRYTAEKAAFDFKAPAPWSAGISYNPKPWFSLGAGIRGTDSVMGRLTLRTQAASLPGLRKERPQTAQLQTRRGVYAEPGSMASAAAQDGIRLSHTALNQTEASATLHLEPGLSLPRQLGQAAVHMANNAGPNAESIAMTPAYMGLSGPKISILRKDLERALIHHQSSPEEL